MGSQFSQQQKREANSLDSLVILNAMSTERRRMKTQVISQSVLTSKITLMAHVKRTVDPVLYATSEAKD